MNAKYVRYIILVLLLSGFSVYSQTIPFGFFKKVTSLVYSFMGATLESSGFVTNAQFKTGSKDGAFYYATDVAVDPVNDFLYVADTYNHRIQKFILSTGAFVGAIGNSTLSGTCLAGKQNGWCTGGVFSAASGAGQFKAAYSISIDVANNLLYVGSENSIQKFNLSSGAYLSSIGKSTASGTCIAGAQNSWCTGGVFSAGTLDGQFDGVEAIRLDVAGNLMYAADRQNSRIQKFNLSTGAFIGAIGKSTASGTCVAGKQNTWCTGGVFSLDASDGSISPSTIAIDVASDVLIVANPFKANLQKFILSTGAYVGSIGRGNTTAGTCNAGAQTSWCTGGDFNTSYFAGGFWSPSKIMLDPANDRMYIVDAGVNYRVSQHVLSTGVFVSLIGAMDIAGGTCVQGAQSGWCDPGAFNVASMPSTADGGFYSPYGLAIDTTNNRMYVLERDPGRLNKFVLSTGAFIGAMGNTVKPFTSWTTTAISGLATTGLNDKSFNGLNGIVVDSANDKIYVSDNAHIQKMTLSTTAFIGAIGSSFVAQGTCSNGAQFNWCIGGQFGSSSNQDGNFDRGVLAADLANDFLYVSDGYNRIQKFTLSTGAFIGSIGKAASTSGTCVAGAQGSWCVGGFYQSGAGDGMFNDIAGIAFDSATNILYVADRGNFRIQKFNAATGAFVGSIGKSTAAGTCIAGAQTSWCTGGTFSTGTTGGQFDSKLSGLAIDPVANKLYARTNYSIQKFSLSTGAYEGSIGKSTAAGTCTAGTQAGWCTGGVFSTGSIDGQLGGSTTFLAVDSDGKRLFVGEGNRLQKFNLTNGGVVGTIGKSTAVGTCSLGAQNKWCFGGVFSAGDNDGEFNGISTVHFAGSKLYVGDGQNRVQRFTP
jgi:sugar lactone lactonase YvrE